MASTSSLLLSFGSFIILPSCDFMVWRLVLGSRPGCGLLRMRTQSYLSLVLHSMTVHIATPSLPDVHFIVRFCHYHISMAMEKCHANGTLQDRMGFLLSEWWVIDIATLSIYCLNHCPSINSFLKNLLIKDQPQQWTK